ncbi:S8 family serine peptidase [bacterium]|nr:S8 family serine peptidase [bacterium]
MKNSPVCKLFVPTFLLVLLIICSSFAQPRQTLIIELEPEYVTDIRQPSTEWLSQFEVRRDGFSVASNIKPLKWAASAEHHPLLARIFSIDLPDEETTDDWLSRLESTSGVAWVELQPIRYTCGLKAKGRDDPDAPPNDPYFPLQWSLRKINASAAWDITRGDTSVIIAIVDVGVDIDHGDLTSQVWVNRAEADGETGVDDDGNGFIDDLCGWDFIDDDNDPHPRNYRDVHGTHVAGIAAAAVDNGYGIAGVGWNCRLMAVRTGYDIYISRGYEGIVYAAASGADIINLSWGGKYPSNIERLTVEYAIEQGALVVGAAGNRDREFDPGFIHYPSAYESVLGVAGVSEGDLLFSLSNYGEWIGISAPGYNIISTIPGNGFGILSGTSMATPIIAGAAGLLKSLHPDWTPHQLKLQLVNSSDPVDGLNPSHSGRMGIGRINLFRALSDLRSGFELTSVEFDDVTEGNGNGIIDPADHILITVTLTNLLTHSANVTGKLVMIDDRYAYVDPFTVEFGEIAAGESADNSAQPFRVFVSRSALPNRRIDCRLELSGENVIEQSILIPMTIRAPYADHDNGSVTLTVTDFGALGYYDYLRGEDVGSSFCYAANSLPTLYHGSLMIGAPPNRVSDCAYGDSIRLQYDFDSPGDGFILEEGASGVLEGHAMYDDGNAINPLNITVRQSSYSFATAPDDDYVILSYDITNNGSLIDSLYVALFLDWDVVQSDGNNCRWDPVAEVGWMEFHMPDWELYGAALLDHPTTFQAATGAYQVSTGSRSWDDRTKMNKMLSGFAYAETDEVADWTQLIGAGPIRIDSLDSEVVTFAILAGDDRDDMAANVTAAREKWLQFTTSANLEIIPGGFRLINVYPSPFNSRVNVLCSSDFGGGVIWSMYDPTGRLVITGQEILKHAGRFTLTVNGEGLPSGLYLVHVSQNRRDFTVPVTLVR